MKKNNEIFKFIFYFLINIIFLIRAYSAFCAISPQTYEEIKKDFTSLSGLIIGIEDGQIIIDKGKAQGVKPKDIFTVYKRAKKIIHPETEKTLGFLKEIIGKIEITNTEENFAIGRVIFQKEPFPVPTPIERLANSKILIISEARNFEENLYLILKNILPESTIIFDPNLRLSNLTPQYLLSQQYDLVFVIEEEGIKVYNYKLDLMRYYGSITYKIQPKTPSLPPISPPYPSPSYSISFTLPKILGKTKEEVFQAEFTDIDNDNYPEMIYFNSKGLFIVKIKGDVLAHYLPKTGKIINFSIGPSGWIALNILEENTGMRSEILKYSNQGLNPVITNINLILNFVDYTGTGIKDTLIGQTFDSENFFGKEVYILKRENNNLVYAAQIRVPPDYRNIGSVFIDLDKDGTFEILSYLSDGKIGIYKNSTLIWSSPYSVSKHFYEIPFIKGKKGKEIVKQTIYPSITPIIADINKDTKSEVIFICNNFPLEPVKGDLKYIPLNSATSQIFILGFDGTYYFRNLGTAQTGFITGLGIFNNEFYYTLVKGNYPGDIETELYLSYF